MEEVLIMDETKNTNTSQTKNQKKIRSIGTTRSSVGHEFVAKALGAEKTGIEINTKQNPYSLFALRQHIVERLRSSGGRPSLIDTEKERKKLPLCKGDWSKLKKIASYYKEHNVNVSPAQIASLFVHESLKKLKI